MTSNQKKKAIVFMGLSVLITALFAASLSQMEFKPGLPIPLLEGYHINVLEYAQSDRKNLSVSPMILRLLEILLALYLLVILYTVIMGTRWKKLLEILGVFIRMLGVILILILGIFLLLKFSGQPVTLTSGMKTIETPLAIPIGSIPTGLIWSVGISLALLAALWLFYGMFAHRRSRQGDLLTEPIVKASQNILAGMDLDEVILRCYLEMGRILQQEGGIDRQVFTTPTEFEYELCSAGLPRTPIHELTRLFERVRYGHCTPTPADEREALSNLQKIITHLREKKGLSNDE